MIATRLLCTAAALSLLAASLTTGYALGQVNVEPHTAIVRNDRISVVERTMPPVTVTATVRVTQRASRSLESTRSAAPKAVSGGNAALTPLQLRIRWCESRDDYRAQNPTSSASGAWQFLDSTWHSVTGLGGSARDYSRAQQDAAFLDLYASAGTRPWDASRGCWA
jgi:hypothetical protein